MNNSVDKTINDSQQKKWQQRKGWQTADIYSSVKKDVVTLWFITLVLFAACIPAVLAIPEEILSGNYPILLVLLFPVAGIVLLYQAISKTLDIYRYGRVPFHMDPYPGSIGGHVGGTITINKLPHVEISKETADIKVRLECVYSYVSGTGKSQSRKESIKWAEEGEPLIGGSGRSVELSFQFSPPENLPEADIEQTGAYHMWRLSVTADVTGVDFKRQYNIPVLNTITLSRFKHHDISAQSSSRKQNESVAIKAAMKQGDFKQSGLTRAARVSITENEIKLHYPMFRNRLLIFFMVVLAAGFGFASYNMIVTASEGGWFGVLLGVFCIPFVIVAVIAFIAMIYLAFNNLRVLITDKDLRVIRRLLFIPIDIKNSPVDEVIKVSTKRTGSRGQGIDKIEHF